MEAASEGKGLFDMIATKPAATLGAIGGVTAGVSFGLGCLFSREAKKGDTVAAEREKMANTAQTIGLSFLAAAVVIAVVQTVQKKL